ncbi:MAG: hypothetical protein FWG98_15765 [Candidatus Cloacimonetes bacterium]|nr:hypothetical protein [Candidatus Cloacimonadota bacterium]
MEPKLEISSDFTLEDIHKIRDYTYEITKNMTAKELCDYYNKSAEAGFKRIEDLKAERSKKNNETQT